MTAKTILHCIPLFFQYLFLSARFVFLLDCVARFLLRVLFLPVFGKRGSTGRDGAFLFGSSRWGEVPQKCCVTSRTAAGHFTAGLPPLLRLLSRRWPQPVSRCRPTHRRELGNNGARMPRSIPRRGEQRILIPMR